jgi:hypothetical protein
VIRESDDSAALEGTPGEAAAEADGDRPRKERVLHTRVPAVLEQELKRLADGLRVPVSNVVRTILEDAISTIDSVGRAAEGELRDVAERLHKQREKLRWRGGRKADDGGASPPPERGGTESAAAAVAPLGGVIGFQPLLLAQGGTCALCGRALARGDRGFLAIRDAPGPRTIVGRECLPFSYRDESERDDSQRQEENDS